MEKERYIWKVEKNDCYSYECYYDNEDKRNLYNNDLVLKILNQQDKEIKRLNQELIRVKNNCIGGIQNQKYATDTFKCLYYKIKKENQQLLQSQKQLAIDKLEILLAVFASTIIDEVLRNYVCSIIRGEIENLILIGEGK